MADDALGISAAPRDGSGADAGCAAGGAAASNAAPPRAMRDVSALVAVRVAGASDLDAVMQLQAACHPPALHESASCLASILAHGASHVAHDSGGVLAYALVHPGTAAALGAVVPPPSAARERERCVFLHDVAVSPAAQRTGLARLLVHAVLARAEAAGAAEAHLVALPGTAALWARFRFQPCAADDAASYGAGATHMRARLAGAG
jgi:predicted N-acetyltransferase YhbS